MTSAAVFFLGKSRKNSSMYWISSAPCCKEYCLRRCSTGAYHNREARDFRLSNPLPLRIHPRVERLVAGCPVLHAARFQDRLANVPSLLEHADRSLVVGKGQRNQAQEVRGPKDVLAHEHEGFGGDAAAPVRLAEPVPNLGGKTLDICARHVADRPDRLAADVDGEIG